MQCCVSSAPLPMIRPPSLTVQDINYIRPQLSGQESIYSGTMEIVSFAEDTSTNVEKNTACAPRAAQRNS